MNHKHLPNQEAEEVGLSYYPTEPQTSFREYYNRYRRLFFSHWWLLLLTASAGVCYQAWKIRTTPNEYLSESKLVLTGKIDIERSSSYREEMMYFFDTQEQILDSREIQHRVTEHLKLVNPDVAACNVKLGIKREEGSAVFTLSAKGSNRAYPHAYLDQLMEEYINMRSEMRTKMSNNTLMAITDQLARLQEDVTKQEAALDAFLRENDIVILQEGTNSAAQYLAGLNQRKAALETELNLLKTLDLEQNIGRKSREDEGRQLESESTVKPEANGQAMLSVEQEFVRIKREIEMLRVEKARLSKYLKPAHPKIVGIDRRISKAQSLREIYRDQSEDAWQQRVMAVQLELSSLNAEVAEWEAKTLDVNQRLGKYQRLMEDVNRARGLHEKLLLSLHSVDQARNLAQDTISIMEHASESKEVVHPVVQPLLKACLAGMGFGILILVGLSRIDDRLHSSGDYFQHFEEDFLGAIPAIPKRGDLGALKANDERHIFSEAFRKLRSSILFKRWEDRAIPRSLLVTSAIPFDGKSTVASNLAVTMALGGARVLLVDGDLRRGRLHSVFGVPQVPGMAEVLLSEQSLADCIVKTDRENLWFLPSGGVIMDPSEKLLTESAKALFGTFKDSFDYVIIDSAPVLVADDTLSMAQLMEATLFVIRLSKTSTRVARRALEELGRRQIQVAGVILNHDRFDKSEYKAYGYEHYYQRSVEYKKR